MKRILLTSAVLSLTMLMSFAQTANMHDRALWATIAKAPSSGDINLGDYKQHNNKVLVAWRMLPGDDENTAFDLYRTIGTGTEVQLNATALYVGDFHYEVTPITATNYQDNPSDKTKDITYRLTYSGNDSTIAEYTISADRMKNGLPYISIPLKSTEDVYAGDDLEYQANDVSVGDLDGDGQFEIVVKRLQSAKGYVDGGIGASYSSKNTIYAVIWDAYKLDGTFLWRIKGGPGIFLGNSSAFAVADFDGDGCAEMALRTTEGTVFGDGEEIGDVDGDGIIDYRTWGNLGTSHEGYVDHYMSKGPEFISVIDGKTGRELARDNFINRDTSQSWGDDYWKRANSLRVGVAQFDNLPSIILGRGVYARSVLEAWDWRDGKLTRRWHFDTAVSGGSNTNKDGKPNSSYAGQGNHSFTVADLDGDGKDEIMYGSMALDDDGYGLWTSELGHGDAQHVGKFLPQRDGIQVWHCLESGRTMVALHDAKDGTVIWKKEGASDNDTGRAMVADTDPNSPGCEFWWAGSKAWSQDGTRELDYTPSSCNMGIWFDGTLSRQLINAPSKGGGTIQNDRAGGRTFTVYRFDTHFINGTKANSSWYGDIVGDWREEFIVPDATLVRDLKIFSTWYPTTHKFPWLMTDHQYYMGVLNENIGYNQPPNLSYYLGTDLTSDREAWEAGGYMSSAIHAIEADGPSVADDYYYNMNGQRMTTPPVHGVYIHDGRKYVRY